MHLKIRFPHVTVTSDIEHTPAQRVRPDSTMSLRVGNDEIDNRVVVDPSHSPGFLSGARGNADENNPACHAAADIASTEPRAPPASPKIDYPIESAQADLAPRHRRPRSNASDPAMREALAHLFKGNKLPEFVQPMSLIRNIVATIDNLPRSKAAPRLWPVRPTPGALSTINAGDNLVIAPNNSVRYAPFVALVHAVDSKQLVAIYVRFYPLFQQAFASSDIPTVT